VEADCARRDLHALLRQNPERAARESSALGPENQIAACKTVSRLVSVVGVLGRFRIG
jgi:hypothetical protein